MPKKNQPTDGLGPYEIAKIRSAVRQVWQRCKARRLCVNRAKLPGDYFKCEQCEATVPKIHVDHIDAVGDVTGYGFIDRLFVGSHRLQAMCTACHKTKTQCERKAKRAALATESEAGK